MRSCLPEGFPGNATSEMQVQGNGRPQSMTHVLQPRQLKNAHFGW